MFLSNIDTINDILIDPKPFEKLKWEVVFNYYNSLRTTNENLKPDSLLSLYACRDKKYNALDTLVSGILSRTKMNNVLSVNNVSCDLNGSNTYKKIYSCLQNGKSGVCRAIFLT